MTWSSITNVPLRPRVEGFGSEKVQAWPTIFVIDKQGRIRWEHVGEGRYEETENVIKGLLAE